MRAKTVDLGGSSGFAEGENRKGIELGFFGTAIADGSPHASDNYFPVAIFDLDVRPNICLDVLGFTKAWCQEPATVNQRSIGSDHLNRSCLKITTLTDRILWTPFAPLHLPGYFSSGIDPGLSAETKLTKGTGETRFL